MLKVCSRNNGTKYGACKGIIAALSCLLIRPKPITLARYLLLCSNKNYEEHLCLGPISPQSENVIYEATSTAGTKEQGVQLSS